MGSLQLDSSPPLYGPPGSYHSLAAPIETSTNLLSEFNTTAPMAAIVITTPTTSNEV